MRLDVVKLDPMISFHRIGESSNEAIDLLVKEGLGGIADRTRCHIELYHHPASRSPGRARTRSRTPAAPLP
jgi:hypothetical protein